MTRKILLSILLLAGSLAAQNQYYVSTAGSDSNAGTTPATAWRHISKAVASFTVNSVGAVINVAPGLYSDENISCLGFQTAVCFNRGGPSQAVRVRMVCTQQWSVPSSTGCRIQNNAGDAEIVVSGNNVDIGSLPQFGFDITSTHDVSSGLFAWCEIPDHVAGTCTHGVSVHFLGNSLHDLSNTVNPCEVNPNGHPAIQVGIHHGPFLPDSQIIGNRITNIGNQSLALYNGGPAPGCLNYYGMYIDTQGALIQNNIIQNVTGFGIQFYSASCTGNLTNNTIDRTERPNIVVGDNDCNNGLPVGNLNISNNILGQAFSGGTHIEVGVQGGGGPACSTAHPNLIANNVFRNDSTAQVVMNNSTTAACTTVQGSKSEAQTATFVSWTNGSNTNNYHLKAGSQAIGQGGSGCVSGGITPCIPPMDFDNLLRPASGAQDIGVYKFVTGGVPLVSFSPSPLDFGGVPVSTSKALTATLQNTGGANLTFSAPTITGTNAGDFKITTNPCVSPLAAAASCGIVITATPSATGARSASLTLTDNAAGSPHQLPLTVTGGSAALTLSPTSLSFGSVVVGQCSAAPFPLVTVTSTGTAPLTISSETLGGANPADFQFAGTGSCNAGQSYAPGQSCTISQKFCPTSAGAKSATVLIATNAPGSPQSFTETGGGGVSAASITPTSFNFGNQQVGTSSGAQNFTYTNTGTLPLTAITVGLVSASYSQTNNCPNSLPPGGSCGIAAVFKPVVAGPLAASLAVASSASPATASLNGTGIAATGSISLSPTSVSFADTLVGNFSPISNVTVTNTGTASVAISGVSVVGANPGDFTAGECATTATGFTDNFDQGALSSKWQIDTGTAPGTIAGVNTGTFSAANVDLSNGMLGLKVTQSGSAPAISVGGEVRSTTAFGFGTYKWSSRMASTATTPFLTGTVPTGQVSSNFILNSSVANPYTEIDSPEVTGNQPNLIQWTTWTTPSVRTATTATLANPELAFHLYSFKWTASSVVFSLDGTVSQTHTTNIPTAPANPMMNLWGTNSTFGGAVTAGTRWMFFKAFSFTPAGTTTLAPAASCTIPVYFSPQSTGLKSANLSVADSASGSPHQAALSGNGTAPVASLGPASNNFGSQPNGTQGAPFSFTWSNIGTGPMRWTVSLAGTNPGDFVLGANSCAMPLPGGQNCLIPVSFAPTTTGARSAILTLVNSAGTPVTAVLTGTGVATAPAVCLSRTSINFGNLPVGQTSGTFPTTVTNCGNANLVVSSVTPTGDFTETTTCATVIPGATCTVNAKFAPTVAGTRTGNVSIASNAASTPDLIALTGFGTQSGATLTSTAAFGHVTVGSVSSIPLTLANIGNVSLALGTVTITGPGAGQFSFASGCAASLAVGANCTINTTFAPQSAAAFTATLTQPFTDGTTAVTSALSGTGDAPLPTIGLTPTSIEFGDVQQGSPSATQTIQVQNTSAANLTIASILPTGANAVDVGITSHCGATPVTIAPGNRCTVDVTMTPSIVGDETAAVAFSSNAASSPDSVSLTIRGTAVPVPRALLAPTSLSFSPPSVQTGTVSGSQGAVLNNIGNANLLVSGVAITGPNAGDFTQTNNCGTVLPGSSCAASVNCAPVLGDVGSLTANLVFTDNDPTAGTQTATLSCTSFAGTPIITLGVTSIDFGNQTVGTTSGPLVFVPVNTGTADATGVSITATGDFAVSGTCGPTIAAGAHCSEQVTFTPQALCGQIDPGGNCTSNVHTGQISVVSNTSNSPQIITLTGTAIPVPPPPGPIKVILGGVLQLGGHLVVGVQ